MAIESASGKSQVHKSALVQSLPAAFSSMRPALQRCLRSRASAAEGSGLGAIALQPCHRGRISRLRDGLALDIDE